MKKIAFITPEDAEYGFRLTGSVQYIADRENFISVLKTATGDPDTGLTIVDERLVSERNEEIMRVTERAWSGILIVLPSPERPEAEVEDYASRLIRKAIGYHVRLKI